jgi:hypothetical protein
MQFKDSFLFFLLSALMSTALSAQNVNVTGVVQNSETKQPIPNVKVLVEGLDISGTSNETGTFLLENVPHGPKQLSFSIDEIVLKTIETDVKNSDIDLGAIDLVVRTDGQVKKNDDEIPIISLSDDDIDQDLENQNISGILSASRDVFVSAAAFTFGPMRFRIRGYDSENTIVYMNGAPVNELNSGRVFWNAWGGLNDVTRNRTNDVGLSPTNYSFGGIGGASSIDTRASTQRKQLRLSYSISNRSYRNRVMGTWSSGLLKNGWAVSISGSRRWADEGYIEGTFYDAWAYFLSVDKKLNDSHSLNITAYGAPIKRGRSSGSFQELYDLTNNNYYNPVWGFQQGEKRNSRVANSHEPTAILRHDWNISEKASLTTAVSYQFGRNGSTALDWFDANDPRPDYYRKLPSYFEEENAELAAQVAESFKDPTISQLDWDAFYERNRTSQLTSKFASLLEGQTYSGNWSQYIIEDRRYDSKDLNLNTVYENNISDNFKLNFGLTYQNQVVHNFKEVVDLLGGDFYVNVDRFAVRDSVGNQEAQLNDLENPDLILQEGDIFGYNYKDHINQYSGWIQGQFTFSKLDFFLAANASQTQFWREGLYRTGRFPNTSLGESEKQNFTNYGVKGGLTYKISGRHYLYANGAYITRAPYIRNAYVSPRTRDQLYPNLTDEKMTSGEAGYILRSPNVKGRATVYYTQFEDQLRIIRFFNDLERAFGNYVLSNQDRIHMGTELAIEAKLFAGLSVSAVAAIGDYSNSSRPLGSIYQDNQDDLNRQELQETIYTDNYKVPGMPQQAYTFGINYSSPNYWFANLNFNFFDDIWISTNPVRRTADAVYNLDNDLERFTSIVDQERVPSAFTMDFFGGKSFKFGDLFMYLNIGVNNILDKKDFITGGFEQLRFDRDRNADTFPPRYFYSFGRNYFINISFRY